MKVNSTSSNAVDKAKETGSANKAEGVKKSKESKKSNVDFGADYADKVSISPQAKDAIKAKEIAVKSADIDEAKVARLKESIQRGTYKVDADKIADKLVDDHLMNSI